MEAMKAKGVGKQDWDARAKPTSLNLYHFLWHLVSLGPSLFLCIVFFIHGCRFSLQWPFYCFSSKCHIFTLHHPPELPYTPTCTGAGLVGCLVRFRGGAGCLGVSPKAGIKRI